MSPNDEYMTKTQSYLTLISHYREKQLRSATESGAGELPVVRIQVVELRQSDDRIFALDSVLKSEYETLFGEALEEVRLHVGPYANRLASNWGAHAVTSGSDIYFADGQYAPESEAGKALLAHELAHAVQYAKGHKFSFVEDRESAEYESRQVERSVAGVGLHGLRPENVSADDGVRTTNRGDAVVAFAGGVKNGGSQAELSLADFSARGGESLIEFVDRRGESYLMSQEQWRELVDGVRERMEAKLQEAKRRLPEQAYEEYAVRWYSYLKGGWRK